MKNHNFNIDRNKIVDHLISYLKSCRDYDIDYGDVIDASSEIKLCPWDRFPNEKMGNTEFVVPCFENNPFDENKIGATPEMNFAYFADQLIFFSNQKSWHRVKYEIEIYLDYLCKFEVPLINANLDDYPLDDDDSLPF